MTIVVESSSCPAPTSKWCRAPTWTAIRRLAVQSWPKGTTDANSRTTIEGLSKRGSGQVAGSMLRCAVMPAGGGGRSSRSHVGYTMELQRRVLTHT